VLEAGQIVELGTHAELMERGGLYARLYAMQFRDPGDAQAASPAMPRPEGADHAPREPGDPRPGGLLDVVLRRG